MMSTDERLVYMANQIARNFAAWGEDAATVATADHIASFWEARMRVRIETLTDDLEPIAAAAIARLRNHGAPDHQTAATTSGGSDAG